MQEKWKKIGLAAIIAVTILLWGSLIGFSGVLDIDWLSTKQATQFSGVLFSPLMIGFYFLFPLTFGIISGLSHAMQKSDLYVISISGSFIGILGFFIMFGWGLLTLFFGFLVFVALLLTVETSYLFGKEIKSFVAYRTAANSCNIGFIAITLGLMAFFVITGTPQNEAYGNEAIENVISETTSSFLGKINLSEAEAEKIIQIQKMTLMNIMNSEIYSVMENKEDKEVQAFVASMEKSVATLSDPKTKEKLVAEISKNNDLIKSKLNAENLKKTSSLLGLIIDFYVIIVSFSIASALLLYFSVIGKNMAGFYAAITKALHDSFTKQTQK